jgi:HEAT repeat protein
MKVFVSSTYIDLKDQRKAIEEVINRLGGQYWGMEYFTSRPEEPKAAALKEIEKCDLFVGIYAHRYGFIPEGDTKSVTEHEYDRAQKLGLPCFCFRVNPEHQWPEEFKDKGEKLAKLQAFLERIDNRHLRDTFTTPDNLAMKVSTALSAWMAGKDVSQDDYLNFVAQQFQFIPTIDPHRQVTMDHFYITLQLGQEIPREQKREKEDEKQEDEKGIASSPLAWRAELRDAADKTFRPIKVEEALRQHRVVVLGDPGSGKTTLLRNLAYKFAKKEMPKKLLPIFVSLGRWAQEKTDLIKFVVNWWASIETDEIKQQKKRALSSWLKAGECILLFDGLDEVGEARNDIIRRIEALVGNCQCGCPIVVTSRIVGYDQALSGRFQHFEVMPLNDRQMQQYLDGYFCTESQKSKNLWQVLRSNVRMKVLGSNPFLLTVIAFVSDEEKLKLPARRIDLYDRAMEKLLKLRPVKWRSIERALLKEAAFHFFNLPRGRHQHLFSRNELFDAMVQGARHRNLTITADRIEEILSEAEQKGGLLTQLGERYAFLHLTFQEYLAACAIAKRSNWITIAKSKIWEERWEEVLRLLVAKISDDSQQGRESLDKFFQIMLSLEDDIFSTILCWVAKCASDCWAALSKDTQKEIRDKLLTIWPRKVKHKAWMDKSALYALASVDKISLNELINALENEDDDIRRESIIALGNIGDTDAINALLKILQNNKKSCQMEIINALATIGDSRAIKPLAKILEEGANIHAVSALAGFGGRKVREVLLLVLKESDHIMYSLSIFVILLQTGIEDIVDDVIEAITYPGGQLKHWLCNDLSMIANPKFSRAEGLSGSIEISVNRTWEKIPNFQNVLSSGSKQEKIDALNNIAEIFGSDSGDFMGKCLIKLGDKLKEEERASKSKEQEFIKDLQEKIESLGADLAAQLCTNGLLTANNEDYRWLFTWELGEIGNKEAIEGLKFALEDESDKVRFQATKSLVKIGSEQALEVLGSLLESEKDANLKKAIIKTLSESRIKQATTILLTTLESDPDASVRFKAAEALESISCSVPVPPLVQMLEDQDDRIRRYAVQSLGKIGCRQAIEALYQRLEVENDKWIRTSIWEGMHSACRKGKFRLFSDDRILEESENKEMRINA